MGLLGAEISSSRQLRGRLRALATGSRSSRSPCTSSGRPAPGSPSPRSSSESGRRRSCSRASPACSSTASRRGGCWPSCRSRRPRSPSRWRSRPRLRRSSSSPRSSESGTRSHRRPSSRSCPAVAGSERLSEANGYVETARYTGFVLGPLLGGLLAATGGMRTALLVIAVSFAAVTAAAMVIRARRRPAAVADDGEPARPVTGSSTCSATGYSRS